MSGGRFESATRPCGIATGGLSGLAAAAVWILLTGDA